MPLYALALEPVGTSLNEYQEQYLSFIEEGLLGEDVSFDVWYSLVRRAEQLEKQLSSDPGFNLVYDSSSAEMTSANLTYSMKAGDILVTNGTQTVGIPGHIAIVINTGSTLKILNCSNETPVISTISLTQWHTRYTDRSSVTWTKIYRHSTTSVASAAALWARNTYMYASPTYTINTDMTSTSYIYCSKLVWQAYYYGPSTPAADYIAVGPVLPYDVYDWVNNLSFLGTVSSGEW